MNTHILSHFAASQPLPQQLSFHSQLQEKDELNYISNQLSGSPATRGFQSIEANG